jgi:predicted site-specific integrase-resolvase
MSEPGIRYPAGALVRVADICTRNGKPGLLPIAPRTWYEWVKTGKVPQGRLIGGRTRVWSVEEVLALANPAMPK